MPGEAETLRAKILELVGQYHAQAFPAQPFVPGASPVPVGGRVFDAGDIKSLVDASLDFWLTAGRFAEQFETQFAQRLGLSYARLVNSGSSANLLAIAALTSPTLGERRLAPGDEVITVAAGFPTTVNPIIQHQLVPVFLDVTIPQYNVDVAQLEAALSDRTKAIFIAHTLGNPFDATAVSKFARDHGLWLIEDCCDAMGSTHAGRLAGTFGDLATFSFYPAHHITMGEGGTVAMRRDDLQKLVESFRDWGRDCWCPPGCDNTCRRRFDWKLGQLPQGYDHKYVYSHIGYNLKATDMQAAVGVSQLLKLEGFIEARRRNFNSLRASLAEMEDVFILPEAGRDSNPSWFGFPLAVREGAPFNRDTVLRHLQAAKIGTRLMFAGNLTRQPAYLDVPHRKVGDLANSDFVMNNVFWIGVYPGLTEEMIRYVVETFGTIPRTRRGKA
ncbi:MAG: lipopolysaccharide biosynthesis protein RfbH [Phycisphaerae bacterium]|jgi:CDP-6-deoxy-D-xylo-4-hexulose-3-dehydrase